MILFFDTETTGLPVFGKPADDPSQPRICSIAAILVDPDRQEAERMHDFVRPDGWTVPEGASKVHGLTTEHLAATGIPIADALARFMGFYERADELVAYGVEFDLKMIRGELRRLGLPDQYKGKPAKCAMRKATPVCRLPATPAMIAAGRYNAKTPKLAEAFEIICGEKMVGAHDALNDVLALSRVWFRMLDFPDFRRELAKEREARERAERKAPATA